MSLMSTQSREALASPKTFTILLLIIGLCGLAYSIMFQKWIFVAIICASPSIILLFVYSCKYPIVSFVVYATIAYFFDAINRYTRFDGISIILDIALIYTLMAMLLNRISNEHSDIRAKDIFNTLTIGYFIWMIFIILQLTNLGTDLNKIFTDRKSVV